MRLAAKLTSAILLVVTIAVAVDAYLSVQREIALFRSDMERDTELLGSVLRDAVAAVWESSGEQQALTLIRELDQAKEPVRIRWHWFDELTGPAHRPRVTADQLSLLRRGRQTSVITHEADNSETFCTFIPVHTGTARSGVLELRESLDALRDYRRHAIIRWLFLVGTVASIAGAIVVVMGIRLIGRPLNILMHKAQRVGAGDLSGPLDLRGQDELTDLARTMNEMCRRLDQSHRKFCEEQEKRIATLEQLRHADRLKTAGRLAAGIAHEMGTPLNTISIRSGMIASKEVTGEDAVECAKIIKAQSKRVISIIHQFLDYARKRKLEKRHVDLVEVARQTQQFLAPLCEKHNVEFDVSSSGLTVASVDSSQIEHVLTNLIVNAIHAMPRGGQLSVSIDRQQVQPPAGHGGDSNDYLSISIRDEGNGIAEQDITHIFDPFFTTKDVGEGSGLGLSIVYGIVQEHGGWIDVVSEPGKGSCFTVFLPTESQLSRESLVGS